MGFGCDPELRLSLGGRDDDEGSSSNEQCKSARLGRCVVLCLRHGELEARVDDSCREWLTSSQG